MLLIHEIILTVLRGVEYIEKKALTLHNLSQSCWFKEGTWPLIIIYNTGYCITLLSNGLKLMNIRVISIIINNYNLYHLSLS